MTVSIGVDIGTTQVKAVAFDDQGTIKASSYQRYPLYQAADGMAEQEITAIYQAALKVLQEVAATVAGPVECVAFSTAMHSLIVLDEAKKPLTRVITWADNRAEEAAEEWRNTPLGTQIYQRTGLPMHPMTPLHKIRWLHKSQPTLFHQAAYFVDIKAFIFQQLFGELATDYGNASGSGFFNIRNFTWDRLALEQIAITSTQLPHVYPPTQAFTGLSEELATTLQLDRETPFILGGADGPLSNLGLGAMQEGIATLTVGTSGAIRYIVDHPFLHPREETFCLVLDETHWVIGGATSNGAGIFDWACSQFLQEMQAQVRQANQNPYDAVLAEVARQPLGAQGLLFHPYLLGERAPLWDADATGAFLGLRRDHTEAHMMRAVIEGICLNLARILTEVEQIGGVVKEMRATGGFAASPVFQQIMADVLGRSLTFPDNIEASAFGAVLLGWQSLGKITSLEESQELVAITQQVAPRQQASFFYQQERALFSETQRELSRFYPQLKRLRLAKQEENK